MVGLTHLGFGLLTGEIFGAPLSIALSGVGSVLPDIDTFSNSIAVKITFSKGKNKYLKHRGIMHSAFVPLLIYLVYYVFFKNNIILPFIIGYFSHLFLDMFTPAGIPLFMPFYNRRIKIPISIKTGSIQDYALGTVFYLAFALLLFQFF
jgi:inner membrane protein